MLSMFPCVCQPSGCLLLKSVCSGLLSISSLDYFFLRCWVWQIHYRLWIRTLYLICNLNTSSPIPSFDFCFCWLFLSPHKSFLSWWGPNSSFLLSSLASRDMLSKELLQPRSKRFLPVLSSMILRASCLTLSSFIHFEFICVSGVRKCSRFIRCPVFPIPFAEEYLYSIWFSFLLCERLVGHMFMGPFLGSIFCSLDLSVCFCGSTILSWWLQPWNPPWSP